jgi:hypothetical protein
LEAITRLVADSLARHGFDHPIDPRRLQWSRWFRCDSPHSLLVVPSKPGIFALAEEVAELGTTTVHVGTDAFGSLPRAEPRGPAEQSSAVASGATTPGGKTAREGHDFSRAVKAINASPALAAAGVPDGGHSAAPVRRMLAVLQFSEDDDMAFTLDRMFTRPNPMRARLSSGRCFLRFVVIEDQAQRRSICAALNQWMLNSAEKATGLPADFSSSLELAPVTARVGRTLLSDSADAIRPPAQGTQPIPETALATAAQNLDSGANKNLHCPHPLPSGF